MSAEKHSLIYSRIAAVMASIGAIGKERRNTQQNFNFRGIDDVYNELHSKLAEQKIFTVPEVLDMQREERKTERGGTLFYSILKIRYTFFAEDGSSVQATMIGEGMDSGDKASNKAQAVAHKYALLQVFAIPTEEDKDPDAESPRPAPKEQPRQEPRGQARAGWKPSEAQVKRLFAIAKASGWTPESLKAEIKAKIGSDDPYALNSKEQYDGACAFFEKNKPMPPVDDGLGDLQF